MKNKKFCDRLTAGNIYKNKGPTESNIPWDQEPRVQGTNQVPRAKAPKLGGGNRRSRSRNHQELDIVAPAVVGIVLEHVDEALVGIAIEVQIAELLAKCGTYRLCHCPENTPKGCTLFETL